MIVEGVLAPNPGRFTGPGTNSWVVSDGDAAIVIDPGPMIATHLDAIEAALEGLAPIAVLVTHSHPDHTPAANPLAQRLDVMAYGPAAGPEFSPDRLIADGERVSFGSLDAVCVATPGHTPESVCFRVRDALFTGDHIMGGSTVVVEDMADYMESLEKLRGTGLEVLYPGHGPVIDAPDELISEYLDHRREREDQIVRAIHDGAGSVGDVVAVVYADVDPELHPAAAMSVAAHLIKLRAEGRVRVGDQPGWDSVVEVAE